MKNKILIGIIIVSLISLVLAIGGTSSNEINSFSSENINEISLGEEVNAMVIFKGNINETVLENSGVEIRNNLDSIDTSIITADKESIKELQDNPNVDSIEPDIDLELFGDGVSVSLDHQIIPWGIEKIDAPKVWGDITGKNVKIAVIDSGINKNHPDLINNVKGGISFINNSEYWDDDLGHGTSVAGVIAAENNNMGVVGVAPESELYSIKVIGASGGKLSNFIQGIQWAIDNNMDIIVMSLGISVDSPSLKKMVDEAYSRGIILVAASGKDNQIYYPARYSSVIAVGSIDENNDLTGENGAGEELEFVAPGANIISTSAEGYGSFDGTSMAAPHVAGVIALLKEKTPTASNNNIRAKLQRNAIDLGESGKDNYFGYGLAHIDLGEEKLNATIQIIFPDGLNYTTFVKVEIIKVESNQERVVQTLFYDPNKKTENVSVESGTYKVKQYFENKTYEGNYNVSEGDLVVVPLYGTSFTHQYIVKEAKKIWSTSELSNYISNNETIGLPGDNNDITEGSEEEDFYPEYCKHFWDSDVPQAGLYDKGLNSVFCAGQSDSSYVTAQNFWDNYVISNYPSNKALSYYYLGRVAHLLEDATVPAHMHLDVHIGDPFSGDESYEEFMEKTGYYGGSDKNYKHFNGADYFNQYYKYESLYVPSDVKSDQTDLFKLFWYTAQKTQYWASDDADGNNYYYVESGAGYYFPGGSSNIYLWDGEGLTVNFYKSNLVNDDKNNEGPVLDNTAHANIPSAMKAVAGLYRLFWAQTHNLVGCTAGACCDLPLTLTKENGQQPTGVNDYNFCSGNNVVNRNYYCGGSDANNYYFSDITLQICGSGMRCENGACVVNSCIIPTNGMSITRNTTFCTGNYSLSNGIKINTANVNVDCNKSKIFGNNNGTVWISADNAGFKITADGVGLKNCIITNYTYGIYSSSSDVNPNYLINNTLKWNFRGISAVNKHYILDNSISNSLIGIDTFVSLSAPLMQIQRNNIFDNKNYNLYNDVSTGSLVNATNNWWGTSNQTEIVNKLSGDIVFIPYLNSPADCIVNLTNTSWSSWQNLSCLPNGKMNQSRYKVQYDSNPCNNSENTTYYEYRAIQNCTYTSLGFSINVTADNAYSLFIGNNYSASERIAYVSNYQSGNDVWSAESYSRDNVANDSYLYIVADGDYVGPQGLLADVYIQNGPRILSGDPRWKVTATGNGSKRGVPPSISELTNRIALANLGSNPSGGWVTDTPCPLTNGEGGTNKLINNDSVVVPGIDINSRWMWYNSGRDSNPKAPFSSFNHDEWLIFRIRISTINCFSNLDCGQDRLANGLSCIGNNLTRNYLSFSCVNPGTGNSYCINSTENRLNQTCPHECTSGVCTCTPNIANTTWSNWQNISCLLGDKMNQTRFLIQYDSNNCGNITNQTIFGNRATEFCDFCVPNLTNTSWSPWANLTCSGNQKNQSRFRVQYDNKSCSDHNIQNQTILEYQLVGPKYLNTTWGAWNNLTCLFGDKMNQTKNLTQYDIYGCAGNITALDYQAILPCDFCKPVLVNTSWSEWANLGICTIKDIQNQSRSRIQYDSLHCLDHNILNQTIYEYNATTCNYCNYSIKQIVTIWQNDLCLATDVMKQKRANITYDTNYSTCYAITHLPSDLWNNGTNITSEEYKELGQDTCNYCSESISQPLYTAWSTCSGGNQTRIKYFVDYNYNSCCQITNLTADCSIKNQVYQNITENLGCTPPGLSVTSPNNLIYNIGRIPFNLSSNYGLVKLEYADNPLTGGRWSTLCTNCNGYSRTKTLKEGSHTLNFRGIQANGDIEENQTSFFIDSKAPRISTTTPKNKKFTNGSDFSVKYTENNTKQVTLFYNNEKIEKNDCDSGKNKICSFNPDLTKYDGQILTYYFRVTDIADNSKDSKSIFVSVDTTSPQITKFNYSISRTYVSFNMSVNELNFDEVNYIDLNEFSPAWKTLCSSLRYGNCVARKSFRTGNHNVIIQVLDKAGNSAKQEVSFKII